MKYFKKPDGSAWAFEADGSQDEFITRDMVAMTGDEVAAHISPPPTAEQKLEKFTAFIQCRLDAFAKTRHYDSMLSACTYATSSVPRFALEGSYCVAKRDETWAASYGILDAVNSGARAMPTEAQVAEELPILAWPAS